MEVGKEHKPLGTPNSTALFHFQTLCPLPPWWCYLLHLDGVRKPFFLLTPMFTVLLRPRLLRTCFSIQARRFVRLLCSDSTIRGHGLHSAMSRAAMAIARPTCGEVSLSWLSAWVFQPRCCVLGCGAQYNGRKARPQGCLVGTLTFVPGLFITGRFRAIP